METFKDVPILLFESADKFAAWLDKNYAEPAGVWLKIAKLIKMLEAGKKLHP